MQGAEIVCARRLAWFVESRVSCETPPLLVSCFGDYTLSQGIMLSRAPCLKWRKWHSLARKFRLKTFVESETPFINFQF